MVYFFLSNVLRHFFLRCESCEKEVDYLENDSDIKELKEQVASLSCLVRQLRTQKSEPDHENKSQVRIAPLFKYYV